MSTEFVELRAALAVAYAENGYPVFPLSGKQPFAGSHGVLEASTDPDVVARNFRARSTKILPNIGCRVPPGIVILDLDPRNGGSLDRLVDRYGTVPQTPTVASGRGDGGQHLWYAYEGTVSRSATKRLGVEGIDVLHGYKPCYVVLPPSLHPATRKPYRWVDSDPTTPRAPLPASIAAAIGEDEGSLLADLTEGTGRRHADHPLALAYDAATTWEELLTEQGWTMIRSRDDVDHWRRPSPKPSNHISATVGYGGSDLLYIWSESIPELDSGRAYSRYEFTLAVEFGGDEARLLSEIS